MQVGGFPDDDDRSNDGDDEELKEAPPEEFSDSSEESADIEDFRAQMMRQFLGGDSGSSQPNPVDRLLGIKDPTAPTVTRASTLAAGQVLVANPERFCSRNPFSRPVKDLGRFGLQGPIDDDELPPDMKAQMLPVLVLIEHGSGGSRALLMERRTGALMGDVSMDDYGCVAINPLWLGGTAKQNSLYVVHDVPDVSGATEVSDGLFLGGWSEARPKVADSTIADSHFKFFLGATEWGAGQLEEELKAGAWLALDTDPSLIIKDRVTDWRPGKPKPVWTELMQYLDGSDEIQKIVQQIYPPSSQ
jgi:putative AlgH/UPF0301 family transcriptional regulator